jgi:hypothetical protein
MQSIPNSYIINQETISAIKSFFSGFSVGKAFKKANGYKVKGIASMSILTYLVQLVFTHKSMYRDSVSGNNTTIGSSKDAIYRLMRQPCINWTSFILTVSLAVATWVRTLTSDKRMSALVLDDTLFERPYSKKTELVSKVYDHVKHTYKRGFRTLTLGWTDGATFLPVSMRHLASSDAKNRYCECSNDVDKRTCGGRIKKEATMTATEVSLRMLRDAKEHNFPAKHVLCDTWFTSPKFAFGIFDAGYFIVGRMKNNRTRYCYNGKAMTITQLYKSLKKRRGRSHYLLSVDVEIKHEEKNGLRSMPGRIVYVRNRNAKKNEWIAFLSTDMTLTQDQIIELYGKRWEIEVFFKTIKTYLKFTGEFQQISYEALTAHTAIVALRYMILAIEQRKNTDMRRTPGDLFFLFADEVKDITFEEAITAILSDFALMVADELDIERVLVMGLVTKFMLSLPTSIRLSLTRVSTT